MDDTYEKIEKFQGLTFINTYEKVNDEVILNCFKRDMLKILESFKTDIREQVSA